MHLGFFMGFIMKKNKGQGMTEYLIIVALIAVAAIGVYSFFGQSVRTQVAGLATEISGQDAGAQITASQAAATTASSVANKEYNLGDYNEGGNKASGSAGSGGSGTD